jgi:tetratricopeptide (TPR) repeat protein
MNTKSVYLVLLIAVCLAACESRTGFDRRMEACSTAERNGQLAAAVQACEAALAIAEEGGYPPPLLSGVLYRLARLQRQRAHFDVAEQLLTRSLAFEDQLGPRGAPAPRLLELSLSLAGQNRWGEGAQYLERALLLAGDLDAGQRASLANILKHYSTQLGQAGEPELGARFAAGAAALGSQEPKQVAGEKPAGPAADPVSRPPVP